MGILQTIRIALRALLRNKLRSFLTALGIIIGVAAVVAMVSLVQGAKARVQESFQAMGTDMLILMSGSSGHGGSRGGFGSQPTLTWDDLEAIRTQVPTVARAAPVLRSQTTVASEEQNWTTSVQGTSPDYFLLRSWKVGRGVLFGQAESEQGAKVAVLGTTVADQLFGGADPLGQAVRIKGTPYLVVAVLASKGQSSMGQDFDDAVFVPVRTFREKIQGGLRNLLNGVVFIGARSSGQLAVAERQVRALLRERHRLAEDAEDDFSIRNLTEMADAMASGMQSLTLLVAGIAGVSLLVGGIGIMNIMLVSVTERTREIGLRMAVGAKPGHILLQFLVESSVLAAIGGAVGVLLGGTLPSLLAPWTGLPALFQPHVALIAVVFSALVGIVFGLYPARKASRLDPIEALRYE